MEGLIRPASEEITRPVSEEIIIPNYVKTILNKDFNIKKGLNLKEKFKIDNKTPPITIEEADTAHILSINPKDINHNTLGDDDKLILQINKVLCQSHQNISHRNMTVQEMNKIIRMALVLAHNHDISKLEYESDASFTYGKRCITYLLNLYDTSVFKTVEEFISIIIKNCSYVYGEALTSKLFHDVKLPRSEQAFSKIYTGMLESIHNKTIQVAGKKGKSKQQSSQQTHH